MSDNAFDYIIVGGGNAGCVLANRLSQDPATRVLLLEAGTRANSLWVGIPAGFTKLLSTPRHNWLFQTEPEDNTDNRIISIPKGKGLGGSTLINGMIYVRGQPQDYDGWAQSGARGWSWSDMVPYFEKVERRSGDDGASEDGDGVVPIEQVASRPEIAEAFIRAGVEAGYPQNADYNGATQDGFGYYQVNQHRGRRVSAADAYLKPVLNRPNLRLICSAHVTRVVIEGKRAVAVDARVHGRMQRFHADGEVVLSAGAIQTPQLLELSGIGRPDIVSALGLEVVRPLPSVGENYVDHFCTRMSWRVKGTKTLNELTRGLALVRSVAEYAVKRTGILTYATGLAHGFLRTRPGLAGPDVQLFFMHASYANAAERKLDKFPGMTIGVSQLRPQSRGSIHAISPDPMDAPIIRPNFLSAEDDRICLVDGMKQTRAIMEQPAMTPYREHEIAPGPECSSDEDWLAFARANGQTIYHASGTCRMGVDPESCVDDRLRLRGIAGLRVVDASIMPSIVSGNTQAAVFVIAEKGADMILEDWRNGRRSGTNIGGHTTAGGFDA
ncbi:GMC family oxidoreductase [Amorphus sp. 3PC139-8]|uniref:GMC family oxidoreductase n=1 Tax=Amorphus sp. 3PC139-8 TaxID=2735676 RepID=UPI00345C6DFC